MVGLYTVYTRAMTTTPKDSPKPRKVIVLLTDAEWRRVKIAAVEGDTSIQGWLTDLTLSALQASPAGERSA